MKENRWRSRNRTTHTAVACCHVSSKWLEHYTTPRICEMNASHMSKELPKGHLFGVDLQVIARAAGWATNNDDSGPQK